MTCYTLANQLLTSSMVEGEIRSTFAKRRATLYLWVGIVGAIVTLDNAENEDLYLSVTGGLYD